MSRSLYKGIYLTSDVKTLITQNRFQYVLSLKTRDRSCTIIPQMVGKTISVYNGKEYHNFIVQSEMVGHKIGEFVSTRKRAVYKKKKK